MGRQGTPARLAAGVILATTATLVALRLILPAGATPTPAASAGPTRLLAQHSRPAASAQPTVVAIAKPVAHADAAPPAIAIKRVIDTGGPLRYGTYFWDDRTVPPGPITIAIDLKASVLSVFRGGYEIGTTAVIYGADAKQTPLGTFPILQKDRHHFSSTYNHAPMPYTLRLTGDGVSIHASEVAADYATHGCIGVPIGFAKRLFDTASVGDRVIVTNRGPDGAITA